MPLASPILFSLAQLPTKVAKPSTWDNTAWIALAIGLMATVYIVAKSRRVKKDPLSRPPTTLGVSQQRAVEREMQHLLVELSEMSRQISAQLDTRSKKLELLIDEADKRIARLAELGDPSLNSSLPFLRSGNLSANGESPVTSNEIRPEPESVLDPRHAEIYDLSSKGMSAFQIANQLSRPKGEIDLILALRPRA